MKNHPYFLGIVYSISAFTLWVLVDTTIKLATEAHLPPYEIAGFLGLIGALIISGRAAIKRNFHALLPKNYKAQIVLALLSVGCSLCNAIALKHIPLTSFYVIIFTSPLIIALLANVFLREQLGWHNFLIVLVGFGGACIAVDPLAPHSNGDWIGYIASFVQALFYSANVIVSRRLTQSETIESLVLFNGGTNALVGLSLAFVAQSGIVLALKPLGMLSAAGVFNMIAVSLAYLSVKHAPASIAAPFHYTQIISGALIGYLIWNDLPTLHLMIGVTVIILSGLHFVIHTKKAEA